MQTATERDVQDPILVYQEEISEDHELEVLIRHLSGFLENIQLAGKAMKVCLLAVPKNS
jgi:hypothetical protein